MLIAEAFALGVRFSFFQFFRVAMILLHFVLNSETTPCLSNLNPRYLNGGQFPSCIVNDFSGLCSSPIDPFSRERSSCTIFSSMLFEVKRAMSSANASVLS